MVPPGTTRRPRLILADDHRMVVECFSDVLGREFEIAGTAYGGEELLALLRRCSANCLLLDLEMPGSNGLQLIPAVRRLQPNLRILKDATTQELKVAIGEVLAGRRYISPLVPTSSHRVGLGAVHLGLHEHTRGIEPSVDVRIAYVNHVHAALQILQRDAVEFVATTMPKQDDLHLRPEV